MSDRHENMWRLLTHINKELDSLKAQASIVVKIYKSPSINIPSYSKPKDSLAKKGLNSSSATLNTTCMRFNVPVHTMLIIFNIVAPGSIHALLTVTGTNMIKTYFPQNGAKSSFDNHGLWI